MSLSMYQASVPVFTRALGNLSNILDKGAAFGVAGPPHKGEVWSSWLVS